MSSNNIPLLIKYGLRDDLANTPITNPGIIYYCYDTNELFFDFIIGTEIVRQCLNPYITDPDYGTPAFEQGKGLINQSDKDIIDTAVRFVEQNLEPQYKWQARQNIDAVGEKTVQGGEIFNRYPGNPEDPVQASANLATGLYSHAEGDLTYAEGQGSHAEGFNTKAQGNYSHTEGSETEALGYGSHAEGANTDDRWTIKASDYPEYLNEDIDIYGPKAIGDGSHAEGIRTLAFGEGSHAEGFTNGAIGYSAHAEGYETMAIGYGAHTEGTNTIASGDDSHAEGYRTQASNEQAHSEGVQTIASGIASHAEGSISVGPNALGQVDVSTEARGNFSHAEGLGTQALESSAHSEGTGTIASGGASHSEGIWTIANGSSSHSEGEGLSDKIIITGSAGDTSYFVAEWNDLIISGQAISYNDTYGIIVSTNKPNSSFTTNTTLNPEGNLNEATAIVHSGLAFGEASHSEGYHTVAYGEHSHAEGHNTSAVGIYSHVEGDHTIANKRSAHAEGSETRALNMADHAEGIRTKASGSPSHSEGFETQALGQGSHAEGEVTKAFGEGSHIEGIHSVAIGDATHGEGTYGFAIATNSHAEGVGSAPLKVVSTRTIDITEGETTIQKTIITVSGLEGIILSSTDLIDYLALEDETILTVEAVDSTNNEITISTVLNIDPDTTLYYVGSMGFASHVEGTRTLTKGQSAHAEGKETQAIGDNSHAQGLLTQAIGHQSHAEGAYSVASSYQAHAEGNNTVASGENSHSEGRNTQASGRQAHAEGYGGIASGLNSHVEGGYYSVEEGQTPVVNQASDAGAHAEGLSNIASGQASHAEGGYTEATNSRAHAEGYYTNATGANSHAEGYNTYAAGTSSHAEGNITIAEATGAHAEGGHYTDIKDANGNVIYNRASGYGSHVEGCNNIASGGASHAEGLQATASGSYSHAEGRQGTSSGTASHAEGYGSTASYTAAHAEGYQTLANNTGAHAEGAWSEARGMGSHAEGSYHEFDLNNGNKYRFYSQAIGKASHAEGAGSLASGIGAHSEGVFTTATGMGSHAEGGNSGYAYLTSAVAANSNILTVSMIEPYQVGGYAKIGNNMAAITAIDTTNLTLTLQYAIQTDHEAGEIVYAAGAFGKYSHSEGYQTVAALECSHAEGYQTVAGNQGAHSEGSKTVAAGAGSHAEGYFVSGHNGPQAIGSGAHAEGISTNALGAGSHSEGAMTRANDDYTHSEGYETEADGLGAHSEGMAITVLFEENNTTERRKTSATGEGSHAEGAGTTASGNYSHSENLFTTASGEASHAEGMPLNYGNFKQVGDMNKQFIIDPNNLELKELTSHSIAQGVASHTEGQGNKANGVASHAEGTLTVANGYSQHVSGQANIIDNENKYAVIVGNGSVGPYEDKKVVARSNAYTLDWDGNAWFAGNVYVGGINSNSRINLSPYMTKVVLTPGAWASNKQTATIKGISADETKQAIYINPVYGTANIDMIGNCNVYASDQVENGIVFSCDTVPTSNVEFYVKWQDVIWMEPTIKPSFEYDESETENVEHYSITVGENMTWQGLINSAEYNNAGLFTKSADNYPLMLGNYIYDEAEVLQTLTTIIREDITYHTKSSRT